VRLLQFATFLALTAACAASGDFPPVVKAPFGTLPDGRTVSIFTLENAAGMKAEVIDYGCIVVRLLVPDRRGRPGDVVFGFKTLPEYLGANSYFGAVVGRFAGRIAGGRFTLDGSTYSLPTNTSPGGLPSSLHGGTVGFDKVRWEAEPFSDADGPGLRLHHLSRDGDQGYPGNLNVTVTYRIGAGNEWSIDYLATTDQATPINLTQHAFFNLKGEGGGDILGHRLTIRASRYTPVNAGLIPTGTLAPVAGTPFDFRTPHAIGERIGAENPQLRLTRGYDQNWVLDGAGGRLALAARVSEPESGRILEVWTDQPGLQFYSGNFPAGQVTEKGGRLFVRHRAFALETQHFPDSPNQPGFPGTILRPGETYRSRTIYRFTAQ